MFSKLLFYKSYFTSPVLNYINIDTSDCFLAFFISTIPGKIASTIFLVQSFYQFSCKGKNLDFRIRNTSSPESQIIMCREGEWVRINYHASGNNSYKYLYGFNIPPLEFTVTVPI